jgi:hypothetical protein
MKDWIKRFFVKAENKTARELYYEQVSEQFRMSLAMGKFMAEARWRGYTMQLHIEVDGVFCPSGKIVLERKEGRDLEEYISNAIMGMGLKYNEEIMEMETLWPEMAPVGAKKISEWERNGYGRRPDIAPDGP